jgi:hypothetical protein
MPQGRVDGDPQLRDQSDAPLTLGEAGAVWQEHCDLLWNAEPGERQLPQGPPRQVGAGPVAAAAVEQAPGWQGREADDDASECL